MQNQVGSRTLYGRCVSRSLYEIRDIQHPLGLRGLYIQPTTTASLGAPVYVVLTGTLCEIQIQRHLHQDRVFGGWEVRH